MPEYLHTTTEWYIKEEAMKICLKDNSGTLTYNVLEESQSYYIVDSLFGVMVVSKKEYEPVQEWVDVTSECHLTLIGETYRVYHNSTGIGDNSHYRVTNADNLAKVKVEVLK